MSVQPCPFCGGEADVDGKSNSVTVRCIDCGARGPSTFFDDDVEQDVIDKAEADAVALWNRRSNG